MLTSRERRHPIPARNLFLRLIAKLQVFEMNVVGMPTRRADEPVEHLLRIAERAMRRFQINNDLAATVRTIRAQHALAHALILFPQIIPVSAARHYTDVRENLPMGIVW